MLPVLTTAESGRLDSEAADRIDDLMERAGWALAGGAVDHGVGYGSRVSVLAGPGNNGGDGWVAARRLAGRGCRVTVHQLGEPATAVARRARDRALPIVDAATLRDHRKSDLIVDALFGSGLRSELPDEAKGWIGETAPVVAAHVPSGLDPNTGETLGQTFSAARTVAFHALSPGHLIGHGPDLCGEVSVADIGLDGGFPEFSVIEPADAVRPSRARTGHKWSVGSVLVVGGSDGMLGAAVMAAQSALRFGAGAVGLAVPDRLVGAATQIAPEVLVYGQSEIPERFDVIVAGPGMGAEISPLEHVMRHEGPILLDADAIGVPFPDDVRSRSGPTLVTPHAGEFRRLARSDADYKRANEVADDLGITVLLKGNPTFVCSGDTPICVTSNGPELATIGTGDVLAGMVGALMARGLDVASAAASGAFWHGVAGHDVAKEGSVTAPMLMANIPRFAGLSS